MEKESIVGRENNKKVQPALNMRFFDEMLERASIADVGRSCLLIYSEGTLNSFILVRNLCIDSRASNWQQCKLV